MKVALGLALALSLAFVVVPAGASAQVHDPPAYPAPEVRAWQTGLLRPDRLQHASLAMTLGLSAGIAARSSAAAFGGGVALGLAKELVDARGPGFDWLDLAADTAGATLGAVITHALAR